VSERSRPVAVIAALAVALLLAATAGAMVLTQHLRHEGPVASSIYWKVRPGPRYRVCFLLTRDDDVKVSVVDVAGDPVAVLSNGHLAGGDAPHCFPWDGKTAAGAPAPPGIYHLQLDLRRADRVAVSGEKVRIRTQNKSGSSSASPAEDPRIK
jgi:flagellar hook capping protein FlgD